VRRRRRARARPICRRGHDGGCRQSIPRPCVQIGGESKRARRTSATARHRRETSRPSGMLISCTGRRTQLAKIPTCSARSTSARSIRCQMRRSSRSPRKRCAVCAPVERRGEFAGRCRHSHVRSQRELGRAPAESTTRDRESPAGGRAGPRRSHGSLSLVVIGLRPCINQAGRHRSSWHVSELRY